MSNPAVAELPRCRPQPPAAMAALSTLPHVSGLLALVVATHPPLDDGGGRHAGADVASAGDQFLASLAHHAPTFAREVPTILFATDPDEAATLSRRTLGARGGRHFPMKLLVRDFQTTLHTFADAGQTKNASTLDVHALPERIRCLAPSDFSHIKDLLRYSSIWRSLKRAYGVRLAFADLHASHVMVSDPDGFAWRDLSPREVIRSSYLVPFSDHRGVVPPTQIAARFERPPRPDTNARARLFCSLQPWLSTLGSALHAEHAARFAIGRDWAAWEHLVLELSLLPAPDADLADDPLLVLERGAFDELWTAVEAHWRADFAEAVLLALTSPASLYKHCVRGDVLFLEILYKAYLHHRQHRSGRGSSDSGSSGSGSSGSGSSGSGSSREVSAGAAAPTSTLTSAASQREEQANREDGSYRFRSYRFRNSTARILESPSAALAAAARPVGYRYQPSALPHHIDQKWYHASPSGLSRLWLYAQTEEAARAAGELYEDSHQPLVAFRHDFRGVEAAIASSGGGGGGHPGHVNGSSSAHACLVAGAVMRMKGSAAALQLGSGGVPASLWRECALPHHVGHGSGGGASERGEGEDVDNVAGNAGPGDSPRPYARHRVEWVPDY